MALKLSIKSCKNLLIPLRILLVVLGVEICLKNLLTPSSTNADMLESILMASFKWNQVNILKKTSLLEMMATKLGHKLVHSVTLVGIILDF